MALVNVTGGDLVADSSGDNDEVVFSADCDTISSALITTKTKKLDAISQSKDFSESD